MAVDTNAPNPSIDSESLWDDDPSITTDVEWKKLTETFSNSGYREGITAGKEGSLQEGFDDGFANAGAPLGHELGLLRGQSSALFSLIASPDARTFVPDELELVLLVAEARDITARLADVRLTDVAPRDMEAEAHAREHLESGWVGNDGLLEKRRVEGIEDMLADLSVGADPLRNRKGRPTLQDVRVLKGRLEELSRGLGLDVYSS